jgi:hypothetical protein
LALLTPPQPVQPVELIQPPENVQAGSPEWWVYELSAELDRRQNLIWLYEDYYEGRHKLTFASSKFREAFGQMLAAVSDNWIPLVISASVERLRPQGFLFGESQQGDSEAWRIWQTNYLDADGPLVFTEAAKHGEAYMLVWPDPQERPRGIFGRLFSRRSEASVPRITVEHPSQMVVRRSAGDRRRRDAALKRWQEDDGSDYATLYLPDAIHYFVRTRAGWKVRQDPGRNPLGVVPVVPLTNEPHMLPCYPPSALLYPPHGVSPGAAVGLGRSDQADIITTVDQVNKLLCDMLVASEVAAYRQRWATGLEVPRVPDDDPDESRRGQPIEPFKAAVDRLWIAEGEMGAQARFGEFSATDLQNYTRAIEQRIQSLAARTRTPPHYLLGQVINVSGDALKAAETGLASKVRGKQASFGEGLEEAVRLAFAWMDDERATDIAAEVSWAPSEARSESEWVDSLVKKMALGVPKEQLWADAGYSPSQIDRFKGALAEEAMIAMATQSQPPDAQPPAQPSAQPTVTQP